MQKIVEWAKIGKAYLGIGNKETVKISEKYISQLLR